MTALALTDRDGLYGSVKFVLACQRAGVTPLLGVDLATAPTGMVDGLPAEADPSVAVRAEAGRRTPARGGAPVDLRLPRVTVLALGAAAAGGPGRGWAGLCRLVSDAHLASGHLGGARGVPVTALAPAARHAAGSAGSAGPAGPAGPDGPPALAVLLGPSSEVGRAVLARRTDLARAVLERWRAT